MRLFVDTANIEEIRHAARLGVISGVTTNPSLMAKEQGKEFRATVEAICDIVRGPVSAEVVSLSAEGMIREARQISTWSPHVVVKIPITADGLQAASVLSRE